MIPAKSRFMENPNQPSIVEQAANFTIIECPRCTVPIPTVGGFTERCFEDGEAITRIEEIKLHPLNINYPECSLCPVCDGKTRLRISSSPPLSACLRCRGRGYVTERSPILEAEDEIAELEQKLEKKKTVMRNEVDGILDWILMKTASIPEEDRIDELQQKVYDDDGRVLELDTCPSCDGSGVSDHVKESEEAFLTECQRCHGTGRKVIKSRQATWPQRNTSLKICDVCRGEGTIQTATTPPYTTCTRCDGHGATTESNYPRIHYIETCEICNGAGFSGSDNLEVV